MTVNELIFNDFRNYHILNLTLSRGINVFYGDNAQGKTNLLEGVYLLATGRSFRARADRELVLFGKQKASMALTAENKPGHDLIETHLFKDKKKLIFVNKQNIKKLGDLYGTAPAVIFCPNDLSVIKQGPAERRRFLDVEICQTNKVYYHNLKKYYHVLKQRAALLKSFAYKKTPVSEAKKELIIWNTPLFEAGGAIISHRRAFTQSVNEKTQKIYSDISNGEVFACSYKPCADINVFLEKLDKSCEKDIKTGVTNFGPHHDEVVFSVNNADLKLYGSQGQQKTACLSLKLAVLEYLYEKTGNMPVLLLDDCFSELDNTRKKYLLNAIRGAQTLITATGSDLLKDRADKIFFVKNGQIN